MHKTSAIRPRWFGGGFSMRRMLTLAAGAMGLAAALTGLLAADNAPQSQPVDREPWLKPYSGPEHPTPVDNKTIEGKLLCGYQGWFNAPNDGTRFGFGHWGDVKGRFGVDMWPDTSE